MLPLPPLDAVIDSSVQRKWVSRLTAIIPNQLQAGAEQSRCSSVILHTLNHLQDTAAGRETKSHVGRQFK